MINYLDTRSAASCPKTFSQVLLDGIAPTGGLYVPQRIPKLHQEDIASLGELSYDKQAAQIYQLFETDFNFDDIKKLMSGIYDNKNFYDSDCIKLKSLDPQITVLELFHGPTAAFKDMALQCLPLFYERAQKIQHTPSSKQAETTSAPKTCVLVATSGDTGSAALAGFSQCDSLNTCVLFPKGGVSQMQELQMRSQKGNAKVLSVEGNFDKCQSLVKEVFTDEDLKAQLLSDKNIRLTSANSINWGRLLPQIVYYISAYVQLVQAGRINTGDPLDVCVPSGNFGNILAAYYAKRMGIPYRYLICASNQNTVIYDFITTGHYDIRKREFHLTQSPSMDILISSNLERLVFELSGRDARLCKDLMNQLREKGHYSLRPRLHETLKTHFKAGYCTDDACLKEIASCLDTYGYLLDPHSAVALKVAREHIKDKTHMLVVSTAHWQKFAPSVYRALEGLDAQEDLPSQIDDLDIFELAHLVSDKALARMEAYEHAQSLHKVQAHKESAQLHWALSELENKELVHNQVIKPTVSELMRSAFELEL